MDRPAKRYPVSGIRPLFYNAWRRRQNWTRGRSSDEVLRKPERLPCRQPQRLLFVLLGAHGSLSFDAKPSETPAMPLFRAPHSSAVVTLSSRHTSLAESLGLGRDASFSLSVRGTKTPDDPRTGTSLPMHTHRPPQLLVGRRSGLTLAGRLVGLLPGFFPPHGRSATSRIL